MGRSCDHHIFISSIYNRPNIKRCLKVLKLSLPLNDMSLSCEMQPTAAVNGKL